VGTLALGALALLLLLALVLSPDDEEMSDAVRLVYVHVPMAILTYVALVGTAVASVVYLRTRRRWWDILAHGAAEIGVLFCALTLVTGSIWGRPTWNTWWEWSDVRLVTTLILFLVYLGYLAFRRLPMDPTLRARRAAVIALVGAINIPIVNRSVEWWENRTLHQRSSTIGEVQFENLMLFTLFFGMVTFSLVTWWLLLHRFRVGWLEDELDRSGVDDAIRRRREEG
jgi:heme exporter protein C